MTRSGFFLRPILMTRKNFITHPKRLRSWGVPFSIASFGIHSLRATPHNYNYFSINIPTLLLYNSANLLWIAFELSEPSIVHAALRFRMIGLAVEHRKALNEPGMRCDGDDDCFFGVGTVKAAEFYAADVKIRSVDAVAKNYVCTVTIHNDNDDTAHNIMLVTLFPLHVKFL